MHVIPPLSAFHLLSLITPVTLTVIVAYGFLPMAWEDWRVCFWAGMSAHLDGCWHWLGNFTTQYRGKSEIWRELWPAAICRL